MADRKSKGLCFNCDEKFHHGHICKAKMFLMVVSNEDSDESSASTPVTEAEASPPSELSAITYHTFIGCSNPRTLRRPGTVGGHTIQVLIDTHNFIQPELCTRLQTVIQSSTPHPFQIMVWNGEKLACSGYVSHLPVEIQHHQLFIDCYVLPLQGADVVLGVQWLATLGTCTMNYKNMTISFDWGEHKITLQGNLGAECEDIHHHQMQKLWRQKEVSYCFQINLLPPPSTLESVAWENMQATDAT